MGEPLEKHYRRVYFPGIYTFKVIAVLLVMVSSTELMKAYLGLPHLYTFDTIFRAGSLAVTWAFVISGFLVTSILLNEKSRTGKIRIRDFYMRRLLRIGPVYLLMIVLGFFVLPYIPFFQIPGLSSEVAVSMAPKLALFAIFQPQLEQEFFIQIPFLEPMWCLGAISLFCLIIPFIIRRIQSAFWLILGLVLAFILAREGAYILASGAENTANGKFLLQLENLLYLTRIDCLGIGALGAILVFGKPTGVGKILVHPVSEVIAVCGTIFLIIFGYHTRLVNHDVHAVLLLVLILNAASGEESLARVDTAFTRLLGKVSFAAYAIHQVVLVLVIEFMLRSGEEYFDTLVPNIVLYTSSVVLTFGLAWVVFRFIETPFIERRKHYTTIKNKGF